MAKPSYSLLSKILSGTELLAYVFDGKTPTDLDVRIARRKAKTPEGKRALKNLRAGLALDTMPKGQLWENVALVLPVQISLCKCGLEWEAPVGKPMLKAKHQTKGLHIKPIEKDLSYDDLPREFYYLREEIATCPRCFIESKIQESPHH